MSDKIEELDRKHSLYKRIVEKYWWPTFSWLSAWLFSVCFFQSGWPILVALPPMLLLMAAKCREDILWLDLNIAKHKQYHESFKNKLSL